MSQIYTNNATKTNILHHFSSLYELGLFEAVEKTALLGVYASN